MVNQGPGQAGWLNICFQLADRWFVSSLLSVASLQMMHMINPTGFRTKRSMRVGTTRCAGICQPEREINWLLWAEREAERLAVHLEDSESLHMGHKAPSSVFAGVHQSSAKT